MCGVSDTAHLCQIGSNPPPSRACELLLESVPMNTRPAGNIGTRVNLTLPDDVLAAVDRMAKAGGVGRATLIKDLLEGMAPSLIEMARATELAKSKQIDALKLISDHLTSVTAQADQLNLDIRKKRRASMRKREK